MSTRMEQSVYTATSQASSKYDTSVGPAHLQKRPQAQCPCAADQPNSREVVHSASNLLYFYHRIQGVIDKFTVRCGCNHKLIAFVLSRRVSVLECCRSTPSGSIGVCKAFTLLLNCAASFGADATNLRHVRHMMCPFADDSLLYYARRPWPPSESPCTCCNFSYQTVAYWHSSEEFAEPCHRGPCPRASPRQQLRSGGPG